MQPLSRRQFASADNGGSVFVTDLNNGGSAGLVYGYLFAWAGNILQVLVMAELASM
jgi:hypothetical protein